MIKKICRKYIRTKNATQKEELFELFKTYRNSQNKITKLSKANYYSKFFEGNIKKLHKVWQGIKEIIDVNKKTPPKIHNINNKGILINNNKNIANTFNNFFVDIPKQIDIKMVNTHQKY